MRYIQSLEFDSSEILVRMANTFPSQEAVALGQRFSKEIEERYSPKGEVRFVNEKVGKGFFTLQEIPQGAFVGEYLGVVRANDRYDGVNDYLWQYPVLDEIGRNYVIDAKDRSNHAHYLNHSFTPNIEPRIAHLDSIYHVIFLALRPIEPGVQLCYNYGEAYWYIRNSPELL